ncbi:MAG: hypothetical protein BJ554DRAFT_3902 [Olpidium bornovanus]|uniref:Uncharacterized protein n=1 Tax=Olpidium bornovanus TaxID=278681 RepID=A0A8H7ZMV4_9FUNG|nr:MAG: hypothetical protein BJ554DRAFT_3902 [Olpidium bornovanus]
MGDARLSLARLVLLQAAAAGSPPSAQAPAPSAEVASPSTGGAAALPLQQPSRMPMPGRAHSAQTAQPPLPPFSSSPGWRGSPAWLDGSSAQTPAAKGGGSPRESVPLAKKRKRSAVDGGDGGEDAGGWAGEGRANEEDGDRVSEGVDEGDEAEGVYAKKKQVVERAARLAIFLYEAQNAARSNRRPYSHIGAGFAGPEGNGGTGCANFGYSKTLSGTSP